MVRDAYILKDTNVIMIIPIYNIYKSESPDRLNNLRAL